MTWYVLYLNFYSFNGEAVHRGEDQKDHVHWQHLYRKLPLAIFFCAQHLVLVQKLKSLTKFIKGHILLRIMCFIPLTQTYYAPGWRWPYESHKAGLMNMIVKAAAQHGLCGGKVIWYKACTAKIHAYKYGFGRVSKQPNYICCSLMDSFSPLEVKFWVGFQNVMVPN